jgi:hypothetical protein
VPNVLVRDLPEGVHAELARRARAQGQSLQQFLAGELTRLAATPTIDTVIARISHHTGGSVGFDQAVDDLAPDRR